MSKRTHALDPAQDQRVREAVRRLVAEMGSQVAVSRRIAVSQQTISRHLAGVPAGKNLARAVAAATGVDLEVLVDGRRRTRERPAYGSLPGWPQAESDARRRYRHIPADVWSEAAEMSGASAPAIVTPEWVLQVALVVLMARRAPDDVDPD